ncbi:MAG: biotin/lipoyl-containing protein [Candidatus Limnocylindria bacterium]
MTPVSVPWTDVNSESAVVSAWHVPDRSMVRGGDALVDVETSKALLEVEAEVDGFVLQLVPAGSEVSVGEPVALLFDDEASMVAHLESRAKEADVPRESGEGGADEARATAKARARAQELGIDLASVTAAGLITVRDVEAAAGSSPSAIAPSEPGSPLPGDAATQRLLLIGAGLGATQVADILAETPGQSAIGIIDDDPAFWGRDVRGVPVIGGSDQIATLWERSAMDAVVVTISTSVSARSRFRELCRAAGIPLANVIDRRAKIASGVRIGLGNVVCAFVQLATECQVGDNNFFSAYNSFEHHNVLGSDISTGPGCMTSGEVHIGDRVRLGMAVMVEPKISIGADSVVASGSVIVHSVPPAHAVKTKVVTTAVVPIRDPGAGS